MSHDIIIMDRDMPRCREKFELKYNTCFYPVMKNKYAQVSYFSHFEKIIQGLY